MYIDYNDLDEIETMIALSYDIGVFRETYANGVTYTTAQNNERSKFNNFLISLLNSKQYHYDIIYFNDESYCKNRILHLDNKYKPKVHEKPFLIFLPFRKEIEINDRTRIKKII